ncbi:MULTISPECIES: GNAT family N-acetyltransferase [unclassified Fusibacter]|uniref:GNAT family N-acetyltransferase n=1 Tax=unclassified Fusibacter TaxID=2624464 RepID=UPI001013278D|nr:MULTISPECIES: GNAT family N-acetyltransferase [unclassified Fusibacter]MCK8061611.1 GNAT family N-acetyltransferase [Fusibacter sp. A2]NPE23794.1 GNAT family N-acetyltransferase [Fusibacter sp. A1]RXV58699.1 GNAT family N-acetyltransferase [Fusibacter sp. A1]
MTKGYMDHYRAFLGAESDECDTLQLIYSSEYRREPLNKFYLYSIICTVIRGKVVFSVAPELLDLFCEACEGRKIDDLEAAQAMLEEFVACHLKHYRVRKLIRMGRSKTIVPSENNEAVQMSMVYLKSKISHRSADEQAATLARSHDEIIEGRRFFIERDGKYAASGKVSNVTCGAGNIAIFTDPGYRRRGYAEAIVEKCVSWCEEHEVLPVYLVDHDNLPSIQLAKKMGFEAFSQEVIISCDLNRN